MLIDPLTEMVRYVGKTIQPLKTRLNAHMCDKSNCHRVHWLNQLKALGLKPEIVLLEEIIGDWPWQESERFWIKYFKSQGFNLTNNTSGGDGVPDLPIETRERLRKLWIGKKHKPESIIKIGEASKGRKHTEEHKAHMKQIMTGREIKWSDKVASALRKLSDDDVKIIKEKLSNGMLVKDLAKMYSVHRTTISKIKKGIYHERYRNKPDHKR